MITDKEGNILYRKHELYQFVKKVLTETREKIKEECKNEIPYNREHQKIRNIKRDLLNELVDKFLDELYETDKISSFNDNNGTATKDKTNTTTRGGE